MSGPLYILYTELRYWHGSTVNLKAQFYLWQEQFYSIINSDITATQFSANDTKTPNAEHFRTSQFVVSTEIQLEHTMTSQPLFCLPIGPGWDFSFQAQAVQSVSSNARNTTRRQSALRHPDRPPSHCKPWPTTPNTILSHYCGLCTLRYAHRSPIPPLHHPTPPHPSPPSTLTHLSASRYNLRAALMQTATEQSAPKDRHSSPEFSLSKQSDCLSFDFPKARKTPRWTSVSTSSTVEKTGLLAMATPGSSTCELEGMIPVSCRG